MVEKLVPIFRVKNGAASADWYRRLGFNVIGEHCFAPDMPSYLFLEQNGAEIHLSGHRGDAKNRGATKSS